MIKSRTRRKVTVYDFLKLKNYKPFSEWRTVAKAENFGLIFDMSPGTFGQILMDSGFTEEQCDAYIKMSKLENKLEVALINDSMKAPDKRAGAKKVKYIVCADFMRDSFFNGYKGLKERLNREQSFAVNNGYVRSYYGPIRNLGELLYMDLDRKNIAIKGGDRKLYSSLFSHLMADAGNSGVQTQEALIAFSTWAQCRQYYKKWDLKSRIWNSTHDSYDSYIYKPELELFLALLNSCAEWVREPCHNIFMSLDSEISDISTPESREKTYYKHGEEIQSKVTIEEAINNYNKEKGTNFCWEGCSY